MKKLTMALLTVFAFMHAVFAEWKFLSPTTDYWQELLHLGAEFNVNMLPANSSNNTLRVSAPTSKLTGATLALNNNTCVVFDVPEEGFANGVDGDSVLEFTGAATMDAATIIEINADNFVGKTRLVQASEISALDFTNICGESKIKS